MKRLAVLLVLPLVVVAWILSPFAPGPFTDDPTPTAHPFLWTVESESSKTTSYLYGTLHSADPRVLALPEVVASAIDRCDGLFLEIDLNAMSQQDSQARALLPASQSLRTILPESLYDRLRTYVEDGGMSIAAYSQLKVWAVSYLLSDLESLQRIPGDLLDTVLYKRAETAGKEVGGLETIDEMIDRFDRRPLPEQIRELHRVLARIENQTDDTADSNEMVQVYLAGDTTGMRAYLDELAEEEDGSEDVDSLQVRERNVRMADRIASRIQAHPDRAFFFAVGAAHYLGDGGIGTLLGARGFTVERVRPNPAR